MSDVLEYMLRLESGEEYGPGDMEQVVQWAREGRVPRSASLVPVAGGEAMSVLDEPRLAAVLAAPPTAPGPRATNRPAGEDGISALIPYRNGPALAGYYVSVGSLIPVIGAVAGPVAIGLGIAGLRKSTADPKVRGRAHAWVAIVLGSIGTLISVGCIGSMFFSVFAG